MREAWRVVDFSHVSSLAFSFHSQRRLNMSKDMNRRIAPGMLEADRSSFAALQAIGNYAPANQAFALAKIVAVQGELTEAQRVEAQASAAAAAARDNAVAKEWEFHNLMLGAKDQVVARFGRDANEVQALGLKKASERKTTRQRTQKEEAPK